MQTLNFNCSHCGKLMAVGMNLLGRNVRCPHCKQVLQAPATAGPPVSQPPSIPSQTELEPSFQLPAQPKESHESIFGEIHDEDVFGTRQPKVQMPAEPTPPPPVAPVKRIELEPTVEMPPDSQTPAMDSRFATTEADAFSKVPQQVSQPWPAPFDSSPSKSDPPAENKFAETKRFSGPPERTAEGGSNIFVWILLLYGVGATAAAAYFYFDRTTEQTNNSPTSPAAHPFTSIPDFYGHYEKANRKEIVKPKGMPEANLEVPDNLRVAMKNTLPVHDIEVTPLRIEYRDVVRFDKEAGQNQFQKKDLARKLFLLHLRIKNTSDNVALHPTDPAFNANVPKGSPYQSYTGIFVGGEKFLGGPRVWPDSQYDHQYIEGQENDDKPLGPKEEREYVIASTIETGEILRLLRKDSASAVWHVQLRTGLEPFKDANGAEHDISVTSVIGVPFSITDVPSALRPE